MERYLGGTHGSELDMLSRTCIGEKASWEYADIYGNTKCNIMCPIPEVPVPGTGSVKWEEALYSISSAAASV